MLNCLNLETFHTFLATKPLLPHILSYPPGSLKELIFLIFTETWSLQVFTTENFQQLDCDIHRQERRPHGHGKKYGKFDFSRWKCKYLAQNQPKSMMAQWLCWGRVRLFRFQFHALLVRGLLSTGCTLNFLRKVLKLKSEKTKLDLSMCHHRFWPVLDQIFMF